MSIKCKILLISSITILVFVFLPRGAVNAALPPILPNCDRTCYSAYKINDDGTWKEIEPCIDIDEYEKKYTPEEREKFKVAASATAPCDFNDFVQFMINLANWGLAILAALALVFFMYGGFTLLAAAGQQERIQSGKKILTGTLVGILIVLLAWNLVGLFVYTLTSKDKEKGYTVFANYSFAKLWWGGGTSCLEKFNLDCAKTNLYKNCGDVKTKYVSRLQKDLIAAGCNCKGGADGCFGDNTVGCVKQFQRDNELTDNGIVDTAFWTKLDAGGKCK
jgi:hypothetical protein